MLPSLAAVSYRLIAFTTLGALQPTRLAEVNAAEDGDGLMELFLAAGPMAKIVLGILVLFSLGSWAIMIGKALELKRAGEQNASFLEAFRKKGASLREIRGAAERLQASPVASVFLAGYAEIETQIESAADGDQRLRSLPALERSLARTARSEVSGLARWTPFLATTAAVTPFIGLFGTVWGIMVAFGDIGASGSTSLATVAPGIAEALINTAAGLAAAIPALIGYNYFAQRLRDLRSRLDDFAMEFLNLAERNFT